jgi:hypothetical protein
MADQFDPMLRKFLKMPVDVQRLEVLAFIREYPYHVNHFTQIKLQRFKKAFIEEFLKCTPEHGGWNVDRDEGSLLNFKKYEI